MRVCSSMRHPRTSFSRHEHGQRATGLPGRSGILTTQYNTIQYNTISLSIHMYLSLSLYIYIYMHVYIHTYLSLSLYIYI